MRKKTDARRRAILDAALHVLNEMGHDQTSMASIAKRFGGSKATIYNYFESKTELLNVAMNERNDDACEDLAAILDSRRDDIEGVLREFGRLYLLMATSIDGLTMARTNLSLKTDNQLYYATGPRRFIETMAEYFADLQKDDRIVDFDIFVAAAHMKGMLDAACLEPRLYRSASAILPSVAANLAVEAFLRAYPLRVKATHEPRAAHATS